MEASSAQEKDTAIAASIMLCTAERALGLVGFAKMPI
jgi:hypothetical protein